MDTTYFGRTFGVMVFKDSSSGQLLLKQYVKQETHQLYLSGIEEIRRSGIKIQAIICHGRKGLLQLVGGIPMQMCNFHQVAIIRRYLTKMPKMPKMLKMLKMQAGQALWGPVLLLVRTDKESFEGRLAAWYSKWESFLNERKKDAGGKNR